MKKTLSIFVTLIFCLAMFPIGSISTLAANSGDFSYTVDINGNATITGYTGSGGTVTIPSTLNGFSVTSIGERAFSGCTELTSVTIPDSVTSIGGAAFNCTKLTSVIIPDKVTSIGAYSFGNTGLTSVTIPKGVTNIGEAPFIGCTALTEINVDGENSNYSSDSGILFNKDKSAIIQYPCGRNGGYVIPSDVTSIGNNAFCGCTRLTSITIPNSITRINLSSFQNCFSLTSVAMPNSVKSICDCAFAGCTKLTSVIIPNSVESIGNSAFLHCTSLTTITIPSSVTSIDSCAFQECSSLTTVLFLGNAPTIGSYVFAQCAPSASDFKIYYINEKSGFTNPWNGYTTAIWQHSNNNYIYRVINGNADIIKYTGNEENVTVPSTIDGYSVTSIDDGAFCDCSMLKLVIIPDCVKSIGNCEFANCPKLETITFNSATTSIPDTDNAIDCNATIVGYDTSTAKDYAIKYEKNFKNIVSFVPRETEPNPDNDYYYLSNPFPEGQCTWYAYGRAYEILGSKPKLCTTNADAGQWFEYNKERYDKSEYDGYPYSTDVNSPKLGAIACYSGHVAVVEKIENGVITVSEANVIGGDGKIKFKYGRTCPDPYQTAFLGYIYITNNDAKTLQNISITSYPTKLSYTVGDSLDLNGLVVTGIYSDGSTKTESVTAANITGFDSSEPVNNQILTVNYGGKTATIKVQIVAANNSKDNRINWGAKIFGLYAGADNLQFNNNESYFHSDYYHISDSYFNKLTAGMSNTVCKNIREFRDSKWGGSCYGMSVVVALLKNGNLSAGYWQDGASVAFNLDAPKKSSNIENLINFYFFSQELPDIYNLKYSYTQKSESTKLKELVENTINVKSGGLPVEVGIQWTSTCTNEKNGNNLVERHSILAYDVIIGNFKENGKSYKYQVSIYDPNSSSSTYKYMYITSNFDDWYYNGLHTNGKQNDNFNVLIKNGIEQKNINEIMASENYLDIVNAQSGLNRSNQKNYSQNIIKFYGLDTTTISNGAKSATINGDNVTGDLQLCSIPINGITSDGTSSSCNTFVLPESSSYVLKPEAEGSAIKTSIIYEQSMLEVNTDSVNSVTFDPDGAVSLNGNKGKYNLSITFNDGYNSLPWYDLGISGNNSNNISLKQTANGVLVSGDNLKGVTVRGNSDKGDVTLNFSSNNNTVLLKKINDTTLGAYISKNGKNIYDTLIATSSTSSEKKSSSSNPKTGDNILDKWNTFLFMISIFAVAAFGCLKANLFEKIRLNFKKLFKKN